MLCAWQTACVKCVISICGVCALRCMPKMAQKLTHREQVPSGRWQRWDSRDRCGTSGEKGKEGVSVAWQLSSKSQNHKSNHTQQTRLKVVAALVAIVCVDLSLSLCVCVCVRASCWCLRLASHKAKDCGNLSPPLKRAGSPNFLC